MLSASQNSYMYMFEAKRMDSASQRPDFVTSVHADDEVLVNGQILYKNVSFAEKQLSREMLEFIANFAKSG